MESCHRVCLILCQLSYTGACLILIVISQRIYLNWMEQNNFQLMLPKDTCSRHDVAASNKQTHLDSHLKEEPLKERAIVYSDNLFRNAAIEWLVSTDQVSTIYHNISITCS